MTRRRLSTLLPLVVMLTFAVGAGAAATVPRQPAVLHIGLVTRQDVAPRHGCEDDTVAEPDVAVSPVDPDIAIAAAHDCRFADGGAVTITVAWTHDGGATWHHRPIRTITKSTGHTWDRASDPVVAFGPDGTAYLSVLVVSTRYCPKGQNEVLLLRSRDDGRTWSMPSVVHRDRNCNQSDDKDWLVVDTSSHSPHRGRVYEFWTEFLSTPVYGAPQAVRWSDDRGRTWSRTVYVNGLRQVTQNSQPMIKDNGTIIDTYFGYGTVAAAEDLAAVDQFPPIFASVSRNGGATWQRVATIAAAGGGSPPNVRCCVFAADIDHVTGRMYVAYEGISLAGRANQVVVRRSDNPDEWSAPVAVSPGGYGRQRVNVDVVARAGSVFVSYGTRTDQGDQGGFVQQQLSVSRNGGLTFQPPLSLGPRSALQYAARADGYFPGDYIGSALSRNRLYVVWARSSRPPALSRSRYHQVIVGATLRP